ncbi:hypothetical protein SAMD00019534_116250 [Acytostelium subglobosum LB1]|uniref:hypothetical protein n=1 Tax=Acytostelium subglobosum LB1 TaxID=1410327 RepID=UPI00064511BE|nr:hypothetical protein SAMD00019534_116250 [Acytostelium subglobosum LB1]GAM28449.1 hypothetical protein SAMD00019534_116250 [Acytostelium subglobosum LB1]|eukprot:XP_012748488.1 hypothetical protein SAMD00019534_116250 [Acytostelium subglobosum LB1]
MDIVCLSLTCKRKYNIIKRENTWKNLKLAPSSLESSNRNYIPTSLSSYASLINNNSNINDDDHNIIIDYAKDFKKTTPSTLTHVKYIPSISQPIEIGMIPDHLLSIEFGNGFDSAIAPGSLPPGLTALTFGWSFNQPITLNMLPRSLLQLSFGHSFNQYINIGMLPPSLTSLELDHGFKQQILNDTLPASLKHLSLGTRFILEEGTFTFGTGFKNEIKPGSLPNGLSTLVLGPEFDKLLLPGALPQGLHHLVFGHRFNQPLVADVLPPKLQTLSIGTRYNQSDDQVVLPSTLWRLKLSQMSQIRYLGNCHNNIEVAQLVEYIELDKLQQQGQNVRLKELVIKLPRYKMDDLGGAEVRRVTRILCKAFPNVTTIHMRPTKSYLKSRPWLHIRRTSFIGPARPPPPSDNDDDNKANDVNKSASQPTPAPTQAPAPAPQTQPQPQSQRRMMGPRLDDDNDVVVEKKEQKQVIGPSAPTTAPRRVMGPRLDDDDDKQTSTSTNTDRTRGPQIGPSAPAPSQPRRVMGPSLHDDTDNKDDDSFSIGPARPSSRPSHDDDDSSDDDDDKRNVQDEWNRVRGTSNSGGGGGQGPSGREEWMTSLPTDRKIGTQMQNRTFSTNQNVFLNGGVDTSSWTETREDTKKRQQQQDRRGSNPADLAKEMFAQSRNKEIEEEMSKHNEKYRSQTLMDMHKRKEREAQEKDGRAPKRVSAASWDRDRDMEVGRVDTSRLNDIVKQAGLLNTKFSQSSSSSGKYL